MGSYKLIPLKKDTKLDFKNVEDKIEELSARTSRGELRSGTLPETFGRRNDEICWFEFCREEYQELNTCWNVKTSFRLYPLNKAFSSIKFAKNHEIDLLGYREIENDDS